MHPQARKFIIDVCGFVTSLTIIYFFFSLWLFSYNQIDEPLKESWSVTVGFLSAAATIGAAIIAAKLISNWKQQSQYNEIIKNLCLFPQLTKQLIDSIQALREDESIFNYLNQYFDDEAEKGIHFKKPDFSIVDSKMDEIRKIAFQIEVLSNYQKVIFSETEGFNTFLDLDVKIKLLQTDMAALGTTFPDGAYNRKKSDKNIRIAFNCSSKIMRKYGNQYSHLERSELFEMNQNINEIRKDIKDYRNWLEDLNP
ncbi:hypothetical protein ACNQO6_15215 [Acinetobacter calcoaceticus]|uniref:hypothetical protein n=1 Tax=Acinetobacter calcoaceticus TaxID=471 RepID=UPI003F7C16DD